MREQNRLAEAVIRSLREGAGTRDGAAAIVEPITRDVPAGTLGHEASIPHSRQYDNGRGYAPASGRRGTACRCGGRDRPHLSVVRHRWCLFYRKPKGRGAPPLVSY